MGRPGPRLQADDLAPRPWPWLRGPGDNEATGPQAARRQLATSNQPGTSSPSVTEARLSCPRRLRIGRPAAHSVRPGSPLGAWLSFGMFRRGRSLEGRLIPRPPLVAAGRRLDAARGGGTSAGMGGASRRRGGERERTEGGAGGVALGASLSEGPGRPGLRWPPSSPGLPRGPGSHATPGLPRRPGLPPRYCSWTRGSLCTPSRQNSTSGPDLAEARWLPPSGSRVLGRPGHCPAPRPTSLRLSRLPVAHVLS